MNTKIRTIFNSEKDVNSNAEEFYKNYWTESDLVRKESGIKNRRILDKFFPEGLSGKKILEIGVGGEGGCLLELMHNNEIHGIDVSDSAINNCRRLGINVIKGNLDHDLIPFKDDSFDVVFAFEVFEHFANPQHALEEIWRVLKPSGIFICSTPSTCTHHWPRLFYAELFEMENLKDFIMINKFVITCFNDWAMNNFYSRYNVKPDIKSWSWFWKAVKVGPTDSNSYFEIGRHFWEKRNEIGIRTRPIEAIDMYRKCYELAPDDDTSRLNFAHALVYRFINGDQQEFNELMEIIFDRLKDPAGNNKIEYLARLLLIDLEAQRLSFRIIEQNDFEMLKQQLAQADGSLPHLEAICYEEAINRKLLELT